MFWWILTAVIIVGMALLWLFLHKYTNLGSRSRKYEASNPEMAQALRQAEMDAAKGRMYF